MHTLLICLFNMINWSDLSLGSWEFSILPTKLVLFPRRILSCNLRRYGQSNHLVASIAAALNWSGNAMIRRGGGGPPQHRCSAQHWANGINLWPNAVLAISHPLGQYTVCLGYSWILINVDNFFFFKSKNSKNCFKSVSALLHCKKKRKLISSHGPALVIDKIQAHHSDLCIMIYITCKY